MTPRQLRALIVDQLTSVAGALRGHVEIPGTIEVDLSDCSGEPLCVDADLIDGDCADLTEEMRDLAALEAEGAELTITITLQRLESPDGRLVWRRPTYDRRIEP